MRNSGYVEPEWWFCDDEEMYGRSAKLGKLDRNDDWVQTPTNDGEKSSRHHRRGTTKHLNHRKTIWRYAWQRPLSIPSLFIFFYRLYQLYGLKRRSDYYIVREEFVKCHRIRVLSYPPFAHSYRVWCLNKRKVCALDKVLFLRFNLQRRNLSVPRVWLRELFRKEIVVYCWSLTGAKLVDVVKGEFLLYTRDVAKLFSQVLAFLVFWRNSITRTYLVSVKRNFLNTSSERICVVKYLRLCLVYRIYRELYNKFYKTFIILNKEVTTLSRKSQLPHKNW